MVSYNIRRVSWRTTLEYVLVSYVTSFILFLMIQVFWADLIRNNVHLLLSEGQYTPITFILAIGIMTVFLINLLASSVIMRKLNIITSFVFNVVAFILSLIIVILFSFIYLSVAYPDLFGSLSMVRKIALIPNYMSYLAVYLLPSPVLLWFIFQIVYYLFLLLLIKFILFETDDTRSGVFGLSNRFNRFGYSTSITRDKKKDKKRKKKKRKPMEKYNESSFFG